MLKADAESVARLLIMKLGQDALLYTSVRLDEMREAEDGEGLEAWTQIHEAAQTRLKQKIRSSSTGSH